MKSLQLTLLSLLWLSLLSAQVTFESDTVYLSSTGAAGVYEGKIDISSSNSDLADLRWEQISKDLEPLVWTGYVSSCDSIFFPFSTGGPVVRTSNTSECFLTSNMVNLEGDLPRAVNQMRLRVTSVNDPNLNQELTYILNPVQVGTRTLLAPQSVQISPNPAGDFVQLTVDENALRFPLQVNFFNSLGQLELIEKLNGTPAVINTSALADGFYFLKMETEEGELVKRMVKRR